MSRCWHSFIFRPTFLVLYSVLSLEVSFMNSSLILIMVQESMLLLERPMERLTKWRRFIAWMFDFSCRIVVNFHLMRMDFGDANLTSTTWHCPLLLLVNIFYVHFLISVNFSESFDKPNTVDTFSLLIT